MNFTRRLLARMFQFFAQLCLRFMSFSSRFSGVVILTQCLKVPHVITAETVNVIHLISGA